MQAEGFQSGFLEAALELLETNRSLCSPQILERLSHAARASRAKALTCCQSDILPAWLLRPSSTRERLEWPRSGLRDPQTRLCRAATMPGSRQGEHPSSPRTTCSYSSRPPVLTPQLSPLLALFVCRSPSQYHRLIMKHLAQLAQTFSCISSLAILSHTLECPLLWPQVSHNYSDAKLYDYNCS